MTARPRPSATIGLCLAALAAACADDDADARADVLRVERVESPACAASERMVRGLCELIGASAACVGTDDACVPLCGGLARCFVSAQQMRTLTVAPAAPDDFCVICLD